MRSLQSVGVMGGAMAGQVPLVVPDAVAFVAMGNGGISPRHEWVPGWVGSRKRKRRAVSSPCLPALAPCPIAAHPKLGAPFAGCMWDVLGMQPRRLRHVHQLQGQGVLRRPQCVGRRHAPNQNNANMSASSPSPMPHPVLTRGRPLDVSASQASASNRASSASAAPPSSLPPLQNGLWPRRPPPSPTSRRS